MRFFQPQLPVHFRMESKHEPPRAIIMDHQIMHALHTGKAHNRGNDFFGQFFIRRFSQKQRKGIADGSDPAPKDHQ